MTGKIKGISSVRLEIIDPDPGKLLKKLTDTDVDLEEIEFLDLITVRITISYKNYRKLNDIINQHGSVCRVIYKQGIYWKMKMLLYRPILLLGCMLLFMLAILLPGRIIRIEVTGNHHVPTRYILQCAEASGIRVGCAARMLRSEKVKNQLLNAIPELQWVGINAKGCVATIQVEERNELPDTEMTSGIASIVAIRDGIISELVVHSGTALCTTGQPVQKGEILISGYSDQGLKVTSTAAKGEVFAYTRRELLLITPHPVAVRGEIIEEHTCYRLRIGKKVINFSNHSGIPDTICDKMYSEYYWSLPGGFDLPVSLIIENCRHYECAAISEDLNCQQWMEADAERYLTNQMIAGKILQTSTSVKVTNTHCRFSGVYFCHELIGKVRYEEIFEKHAENN